MKQLSHTDQTTQAGFTLVELSIVLVIIGLIVGGVLAGQDMIKAAEIRATIAQVEEFNTATNTFRDKYRALPGDIAQAAAQNFGLFDAAQRAAATRAINQNGLLECQTTIGCTDIRGFGGENALFWNDLSRRNLIENSLTLATGEVDGGAAGNITPGGAADLFNYLPEAKMGKGNYITVFSAAGRNYYQLTGITSIANGTGAYTLRNALTPQDSFNIDAKTDDGKPQTGVVRALSSVAVTSLNNNSAALDSNLPLDVDRTATGTVGLCMENGANPADNIIDYNTYTEDEANSPACQLRLAFN